MLEENVRGMSCPGRVHGRCPWSLGNVTLYNEDGRLLLRPDNASTTATHAATAADKHHFL